MILPDYIECEVKKYCEIKGIKIINGNIPKTHKREIDDFIQQRLKKDRQINKNIEEQNKWKVRTTLSGLMNDLKVDSPIEEILRNAMIVEGFGKHLRTQFEIGTKRVDFAFPVARLVIEADGKEYHRENQDQLDRDMKRDKYLAHKGWRVLHIEGLAIRRNLKLCIEKIKEELGGFLENELQTQTNQ